MIRLLALNNYVGRPARRTGDGILFYAGETPDSLVPGVNAVKLHHSVEIPDGWYMIPHLCPGLCEKNLWTPNVIWSPEGGHELTVMLYSKGYVILEPNEELVLVTLHRKETMMVEYRCHNSKERWEI